MEKFRQSSNQRKPSTILTEDEARARIPQLGLPNERNSGILHQIDRDAHSIVTGRPVGGPFSMPLSTAQIREQHIQANLNSDPPPLAQLKFTEDDRSLIELRKKGYTFPEIYDIFEGKLNGKAHNNNKYFNKRHLKLKRAHISTCFFSMSGSPQSLGPTSRTQTW